MRFKGFVSMECATFAPIGAVKMLMTATEKRAGR